MARRGRPAESRPKASDATSAASSFAVKKLSSMSALPERPGDIKVRVHKTKQLSAILPSSMRNSRLVFLVPKHLRVSALVGRVQKMLNSERLPTLRLYDGSTETLRSEATVGSYYEAHGDLSDGFLHIVIE